MPSPSRLIGRFFSVLISLIFAIVLPRTVVAGEAVPSPAASPFGVAAQLPSAHFAAWPVERHYTLATLTRLARLHALDGSGPTLCQVIDTVYRADGTPAQGTVVLLWPAFTTAAGQPIAAGMLTVQLGTEGQFNASLAPNSGATPAGTYYRVTYKLNDGSTSSEYWVVPATQTTTIGAIRSTLVPATQAAQFLTRQYADANYMNLTASQSAAGVKTFTSSPSVPTPQNPNDAANKAYVDANGGTGNLGAPPPIGNVTPNSVNATLSTAQDLRTANFPVMDLRDYGLKGDGLLQTGCNITSGQTVVTCSASSFSSADVGKAAFFPGAGSSGAFLNTAIVSYQSATQITLRDAASATIANGPFWYGTDNTAAWCAAMNCTSASPPNTLFSPQPGRTVLLPRGTYFISGTVYTRNNDNLIGAGQAATQILLFNPANNLNALCMGANASGGTNTCALDSGTQNIDVEGILWGTPENGSQVCVNPLTYSGFEVKNNWFECGIGVSVQGNIGSVIGNTFDSSTFIGVIVKGDGEDYGNNPSHSVLISDNHFFANKWAAIQVDGASGVQIHHNNLLYAKQFSIYVASPESYSTYRLNINGNNFAASTGFWNPTQAHIYVTTPLVRSSISGNTFGIARDADIALNSSGIVGLNISNNKFSSGQLTCGGTCTASLQVTSAGAGLTVTGNQWDSPGSYAGDFQSPAYLSNNYCTHPFAVTGLPANDYDKACFRFAAPTAANFTAKDNVTDSSSVAAIAIRGGAIPAYTSGNRSAWSTADVYVFSGTGPIASANERVYNGTGINTVFTTMSDPSTGNASFAGDLAARDIPGHEYFVSKYAGIQAAITAAYNNGAVLGEVIDDRTSPYTGPGFILYDSVTLKLAPTTYTINAAVTYNNGNNNVTAGIISLPGGRLIGASTSTNHGTIVTAANGLNADLIATSTVGTGIGSTAQWWHWGGFENLRVIGNGANQTAGNCFNIENMGETAFLRTIEVSACYLDNILFTGASATPSDIANITTNSAGRYGFNFNNLSGVAVVHGLSGDSNTTSIVRLNGGQSGTLTILGFKTEEEISGQDPLITIDQTGQNGAQPSLFIVGGYTFGRTGVNDVIKYVNGTAGATPYISVSNFYVQNYVNAVNDTVNNRTTAAANMNKVPFYYGPTGEFFSGQAYTLDLNTFAQSPHSGNGILTEIFGTTSSNETLLAASGTSTSISTGGIGFRMPNRTTYGQSPELFAKMTYAFPGGISNSQQWEFIPTKASGDTSTRWIGDPGFRWDEVYSADLNTTTATVGTLNVTNCIGCGTGTHLVSGSMQGTTATLTGNSSDQTIYTATLPAGTFAAGSGAHCYAKWTHPTASGAITYKWTLGTTTWAYGSYTSSSQNIASDIEILAISSLTSQLVNLSPVIAGTTIGIGGSYGNTGAENLANADTIKLTFNAGSSDQIKGATFYCQTVQ
ncbi:MAG: right-handed parallel beta-helix repeat-containing protein [Candidatus Korobacteraceae bacterium]